MQEPLTAANIGGIGNGSAAEQIDEQLRRAVADTLRRGRHDGVKRVVKIAVILEYAGEDDKANDQYRASITAAFAPPPFSSAPTLGEIDAAAKGGPALLFDMAEETENAV